MAVVTDTIADMLTRIRNANQMRYEEVKVPASNIKKEIARILKEEGFIKDYKIDSEDAQGTIILTLKYTDKKEELYSNCDAVYIATSALISIGCKVCQSCSEGICPKGIATQERVLRRRLDPIRKGQQVANYIEAMTQEVTSLTQQAGNTDIEKLERQDLVALTMEASQLTGVPMVRN